MQVDPIIRQIVDRCHVSDSNRKVIRYVVSRMKRGHQGWRKLPRETRREVMRQAIYQHGQNFVLYAAVMSGKF